MTTARIAIKTPRRFIIFCAAPSPLNLFRTQPKGSTPHGLTMNLSTITHYFERTLYIRAELSNVIKGRHAPWG